MQDSISKIVGFMNHYLWDTPFLMVLLVGTGIYYTLSLDFIQIRKFGVGFKQMFGSFSLNAKKDEKGLTSFQALTTAIAAQVGTGNIAGAATALFHGGAGAIFWMWVSAFFGMATIFAEAVLAQKTKVMKDGHFEGGSVYYINYIFKNKFGKFLSGFFAVAIVLSLGFMGNMVQSNSIADSFVNAFGSEKLVIGLIIGVLAFLIFVGGIRRIAWVTEKVVPIMAFLYMIGCVFIIVKFHANIIPTFRSIFVFAFSKDAIIGGAMGVGVQKAIRYGVARGLFSNEAGMGSTPHAHAAANVKNPSEQGVIAIVGVFIDTFIVLTLTALVILTSGAMETGKSGSALAQEAFIRGLGQSGTAFIAVCMFFFAFTTIIGWYYFAEVNVRYLLGEKFIKLYAIIVVLCVVVGSALKVQLVWDMADMFNGIMVIPNLIALIFGAGLVRKIMKEDESVK